MCIGFIHSIVIYLILCSILPHVFAFHIAIWCTVILIIYGIVIFVVHIIGIQSLFKVDSKWFNWLFSHLCAIPFHTFVNVSWKFEGSPVFFFVPSCYDVPRLLSPCVYENNSSSAWLQYRTQLIPLVLSFQVPHLLVTHLLFGLQAQIV